MSRIISGTLLAVGLLLAGGSGLCSLSLLVEEVGNANAQMGESLTIIAIVGGIPFLLGLGMAVVGRRLLKQSSGN